MWNETFGVEGKSTWKNWCSNVLFSQRREMFFSTFFVWFQFILGFYSYLLATAIALYFYCCCFDTVLFLCGYPFVEIERGTSIHFNPFGSWCQITTVIWCFSAMAEWWLAHSSKQSVTLKLDYHRMYRVMSWWEHFIGKTVLLRVPTERADPAEGFVYDEWKNIHDRYTSSCC